MNVTEALKLLLPYGFTGVLILLILYVLLMPDKAQQVAGWLWSLVARVWHGVDKKAVANRVEGDINSARARLLKGAPEELLQGKLKIKWADGEAAAALVNQGEVVVFMRRSQHHPENVAHALMAYLPKALLPRARRYVDRDRMKAADFIVAKTILTQPERVGNGALSVFYEEHLDPSTLEDSEFAQKLTEMDEIDVHGWMLRVLLAEYQELGEQLFPGQRLPPCVRDSEALRAGSIASLRGPPERPESSSTEGSFSRSPSSSSPSRESSKPRASSHIGTAYAGR